MLSSIKLERHVEMGANVPDFAPTPIPWCKYSNAESYFIELDKDLYLTGFKNLLGIK